MLAKQTVVRNTHFEESERAIVAIYRWSTTRSQQNNQDMMLSHPARGIGDGANDRDDPRAARAANGQSLCSLFDAALLTSCCE